MWVWLCTVTLSLTNWWLHHVCAVQRRVYMMYWCLRVTYQVQNRCVYDAAMHPICRCAPAFISHYTLMGHTYRFRSRSLQCTRRAYIICAASSQIFLLLLFLLCMSIAQNWCNLLHELPFKLQLSSSNIVCVLCYCNHWPKFKCTFSKHLIFLHSIICECTR